MKLSQMLSAALLASVPTPVQAYTGPIGCLGDCFTHDPAVVKRSDGKYFRFSSQDLIGIWTADDLLGPWARSGSVISDASVINLPGNTELWAPDVSYIRGTYYLFYAVSTLGSQVSAIGYATSKTLDAGGWTDHGAVISSDNSSPYNAIDANLVKDTVSGQFHLSWGSYWGDIYQSQVAIDGGNVSVSETSHQIAYDPADSHKVEGSFIWPHERYYYLFLSVGDCCTYDPRPPQGNEYHVKVCRSSRPTGPFTDKSGVSCTEGGGTTVLASHDNVYAPGGEGVFYDPEHGDVFYYHYLDPNVGLDYSQSRFGWNVLNWGSDGWPTI